MKQTLLKTFKPLLGSTLIVASSMLILVSCGGGEEKGGNGANDSEATSSSMSNPMVTNFLSDVSSLENDASKDQVADFTKYAMQQADKKVSMNKDNIKEVLADGNNYKYMVIVVGNHTIVKIDDLANCKDSGSWGACMPYGTGYIKKGALVAKEDYINNIIGRADDQERMVFLFK